MESPLGVRVRPVLPSVRSGGAETIGRQDSPRRPPVALMVVVALLVVAGIVAVAIPGRIADLIPSPASTPAPGASSAPAPPVSSTVTPPVDPFPAARPGTDFDVRVSDAGGYVRWACVTGIQVRPVGQVPEGAQQQVESAVAALAAASGLPLTMGPPLPEGAPQFVPDTITIFFRGKGQTVGNMALTGTAVGVGGVRYLGSGRVVSGSVLMIDDDPQFASGTPAAQHVLLHELGHAVGLRHAQEQPDEVMAPTTDPDRPLSAYGPGDRHALWLLGCH